MNSFYRHQIELLLAEGQNQDISLLVPYNHLTKDKPFCSLRSYELFLGSTHELPLSIASRPTPSSKRSRTPFQSPQKGRGQ